MAAVTLLGTATFTTASDSKAVTASPAVGDLIVIVTAHTGNTSSAAPTDNNGGTYTQIGGGAVKNGSADQMRFWVRNSLVALSVSTVFTHNPGSSTGGGLAVLKITGMKKAGLGAIRQSIGQDNQGAGGTPTPVFSSAAYMGNPVIGAVFNASNTAGLTPRSSPAYTERNDSGYNSPATGLETMSIDSGETATSIAWGGTSATAFCSYVVELNNGPVGEKDETVPDRARYVDCNFVAATSAVLLTAFVMTRAPFFTPIEPRPYLQVEPHFNYQIFTQEELPPQVVQIERVPLRIEQYPRRYLQVEPHFNSQIFAQEEVPPELPVQIERVPLRIEQYPRKYPQVDPVPNLAIDLVPAQVIFRAPFFTPVVPRPYRQVDQVQGAIFEQAALPVTVQHYRQPLVIQHQRRKYHQVEQVPRPAVLTLAPLKAPFRSANVTPIFPKPYFRQPEHFRPTPGARALGPAGQEIFGLWEWPTPRRPKEYQYLYFDPPNLLVRPTESFLLAWDEFEEPDRRKYFPQPDQMRNAVLIEGAVTALFIINNVEWPVRFRKVFYEVQLYNNLAIRDQVQTPPPEFHLLDWPITYPRPVQQPDVYPNLVSRDQVVTALYPINQLDYPAPVPAKYTRHDIPPNLILSTLLPQPIATSQYALTPEGPYGYRYFAQPDPVTNQLPLGIAPPAPVVLPFSLQEWPVPERAEVNWNIYFLHERTDISQALAPQPKPIVILSAYPPSVNPGGLSILSWSSQYVTQLEASGGWSGPRALAGAETVGPIQHTTTYRLTGTGPGGVKVANVIVHVVPVPVPPPIVGEEEEEARPAGRTILTPKLAGDEDTLTFDFISSLPKEESIVAQSVTCRVYSGFDSAVGSMLKGGATASGSKVSQRIGGGVAGAVYDLLCTATLSSGKKLAMAAYLSVTPERRFEMSGGRRVWIPKKQAEVVSIPFDFVSELQPSETIATAQVTSTVYSGTDPSPSAMIFGAPAVNGTKVFQKVRAGVVGVSYALLCRVTTSAGQTLELSSYCTVQPDIP